jgi:NTF2 fold immunity protein
MSIRNRVVLLFCILLICNLAFNSMAVERFKPSNGFVPDEKTALVIARAVLSAIYGEENIAKQEPLSISLVNDLWVVNGRLEPRFPFYRPVLGGVARIEISKITGEIIHVSHGK